MKKYFKLFMLMLLVFSYSYAGVMPETEWAKRELKGKVKSMVKTEYGYENSGKIKFTSLVKTEFNEKGYITRESFTRDGVEYKIVQYQFDKNGFIARRIEEVPQASINNYKYSYKYSKDGNLIEKAELVERVRGYYPMYDIITYNKLGKEINELKYVEGKLEGDVSTFYNERGDATEVKNNLNPDYPYILIYYDYYKDGGYEKTVDGSGRRSFVVVDKNGFQRELAYVLFFGSRNPVVQLDIYEKNINEKRDKYGNITEFTSVRYDVLENNKAKAEDIYKQLREQKIKKIGVSGKVEITYEYYN